MKLEENILEILKRMRSVFRHSVASELYKTLRPDDFELLATIRKQHHRYFQLADTLLNLAHNMFPQGRRKPAISMVVDRCLLAQYTQVFRLFRSILLECKSGQPLEAQILFRAMLEVTAILLYMGEKEHEYRVLQYYHCNRMSVFAAVRQLSQEFPQLEQRFARARQRLEKKYQEALAFFRAKHGAALSEDDIKKKYVLKPEVVAFQLGIPELRKMWRIAYPITSSISHGQALHEFANIVTTNEGTTVGLRISPTDESLDAALINAMKLLFWAMQMIDRVFGAGKTAELHELDRKHQEFFSKDVQPV